MPQKDIPKIKQNMAKEKQKIINDLNISILFNFFFFFLVVRKYIIPINSINNIVGIKLIKNVPTIKIIKLINAAIIIFLFFFQIFFIFISPYLIYNT